MALLAKQKAEAEAKKPKNKLAERCALFEKPKEEGDESDQKLKASDSRKKPAAKKLVRKKSLDVRMKRMMRGEQITVGCGHSFTIIRRRNRASWRPTHWRRTWTW